MGLTRGEGSKAPQNLADVISPLTLEWEGKEGSAQFIDFFFRIAREGQLLFWSVSILIELVLHQHMLEFVAIHMALRNEFAIVYLN